MSKPKKKFRDRPIVKWCKENAPDLIGNSLELVGDITGIEVIEKLGEKIAGSDKLTPEQKEYAERIVQADLELHKLENADRHSAREMQIAALHQDDLFSKRFIYYMATGIIAVTFIYDILFFFVEYPERNHDIIMMIAGTLNSTGFAAIIYFFFGSSKGSADKQKQLDKLSEK